MEANGLNLYPEASILYLKSNGGNKMSYDSNLHLVLKLTAGFGGADKPSNSEHLSTVKYLNRIYTVKGQNGDVGSVFFEFKESKPCSDENNYMKRFFKDISKSPDLYPDTRIPQEAKKGFCYGIRGNGPKSLEDLIKKVERWWTQAEPQHPVQVVSLDPSSLESNPSKMPAKNYDKIYGAEGGGYIVPVHLLDPNYVNRWDTLENLRKPEKIDYSLNASRVYPAVMPEYSRVNYINKITENLKPTSSLNVDFLKSMGLKTDSWEELD